MLPIIAGIIRAAAPVAGRAAASAMAGTESRFLSSQFGQHLAGAAVDTAVQKTANNLEQRNSNGGE